MNVFQVWSFQASSNSEHWILAGYKEQKQIVCSEFKKKIRNMNILKPKQTTI